MLDAGVIAGNQGMDLHVYSTAKAREILKCYPLEESLTNIFRCPTSERRCIKIPMGYTPHWEGKFSRL